MFLMFVIIMSLVVLFFIASICYELYLYTKKDVIIKGNILEVFSCGSMIMYMVMVIMFAVALSLIGDYIDKEVAFTSIIVGILIALYILDCIRKFYNNREYVLIKSYSILLDYNILVDYFLSKNMSIENSEQCKNLNGQNELSVYGFRVDKKGIEVKKESFESVKLEFLNIKFKKLTNLDIVKRLFVKFIPLLVAIAILVVGIVRFN